MTTFDVRSDVRPDGLPHQVRGRSGRDVGALADVLTRPRGAREGDCH